MLQLLQSILQLQGNKRMDIWRFTTQGINYERYRPQYPQELIENAIEELPSKNKYLDIAVGTGKVLLNFCQSFKEVKAIDLSQHMIEVAKKNVKEHIPNHSHISFEKRNIMEMDEKDFDLITVGQALHFFTSQDMLNKLKGMLTQGGMFMTFGYVLREVKSQNPQENELFYEFYDQMLPYFTFDMYELHHHYSDQNKYPFEKIFSKVQRKQTDLVLEVSKENYINYLKTWSAYNIYIDKHGVDPIIQLEQKCSKTVTCVFDYFRIRCFK